MVDLGREVWSGLGAPAPGPASGDAPEPPPWGMKGFVPRCQAPVTVPHDTELWQRRSKHNPSKQLLSPQPLTQRLSRAAPTWAELGLGTWANKPRGL